MKDKKNRHEAEMVFSDIKEVDEEEDEENENSSSNSSSGDKKQSSDGKSDSTIEEEKNASPLNKPNQKQTKTQLESLVIRDPSQEENNSFKTQVLDSIKSNLKQE